MCRTSAPTPARSRFASSLCIWARKAPPTQFPSASTPAACRWRAQKSGGPRRSLGPSVLHDEYGGLAMRFRIRGLPAEKFAPLFALSDAELEAQDAVRRIADRREPGYPCRVSLTDSKPG